MIGSRSINTRKQLRLWKTQKRVMKFRSQKPPNAAVRIAVFLYCLSNAARKKLAETTLVLATVGENLRSAAATKKTTFRNLSGFKLLLALIRFYDELLTNYCPLLSFKYKRILGNKASSFFLKVSVSKSKPTRQGSWFWMTHRSVTG